MQAIEGQNIDNGNTWTDSQKIYTGICYEPSILQLDTGEIQVYFTHGAPIMYMNSDYDEEYSKSIVARSSKQGQSSGVAIISSIDNGNTWTPDVKGVETTGINEEKYDPNVRNPYSAYIISQQSVKENYTNIFNFSKPFYWSGESSTWNQHTGINLNENMKIKMTNQMPVAVKLNNGKIAVSMETRETNVSYILDESGKK